MRDPHVVALHSRLETGPQLAFNDPPPTERETDSFALYLAKGELCVTMKDHFATEADARREVDQYLRSWEIATALHHGPGAIGFVFQKGEVIDRDPPPPSDGLVLHALAASVRAHAILNASLTVAKRQYPDPPDMFIASPSVLEMWNRYPGYLDGKEPLPSMAYYCATAIQKTEARLTVSEAVHSRLRYLATMVGDARTLRKRQDGQAMRPHTPAETAWMEAVVNASFSALASVPLIVIGSGRRSRWRAYRSCERLTRETAVGWEERNDIRRL